MKVDKVSKLYDVLTNKEKASLVFRYTADKNDLEIDRIETSVPWKNYDCIDFNYRRWRNGFIHMACFWSIAHWQLRARQMSAFGNVVVYKHKRSHKEADDAVLEALQVEACLLALDRALESTCKEHGLDVGTVRRFASTDVYKPVYPDVEPDQKYQIEMQLNMTRCLPED